MLHELLDIIISNPYFITMYYYYVNKYFFNRNIKKIKNLNNSNSDIVTKSNIISKKNKRIRINRITKIFLYFYIFNLSYFLFYYIKDNYNYYLIKLKINYYKILFKYIYYFYNNYEKIQCNICFKKYNKLFLVQNLNCNCKSYYHIDCINKWKTINNSCPTCRKKNIITNI